jgi:hypothetical protein
MDLNANDNIKREFVIHSDGKTKIYIWNPRKLKGTIKLKATANE